MSIVFLSGSQPSLEHVTPLICGESNLAEHRKPPKILGWCCRRETGSPLESWVGYWEREQGPFGILDGLWGVRDKVAYCLLIRSQPVRKGTPKICGEIDLVGYRKFPEILGCGC